MTDTSTIEIDSAAPDAKSSVNFAPPAATGSGRAELFITVGSASLFPDSTYNGGSIRIENQSTNGVEITSVVIDLTSGFIPNEVFDPATDPVTGEFLPPAGDAAQKDFEFWAAGSLGLNPEDVTVRFGKPGEDAGFSELILTFAPGTFAPNDVLAFSLDIDAASAYDHQGAGGVAGQQLAGSLFTVNYSDGTSATGTVSPEADNTSGATAVAHVGSNQTAPTLTLADGSTAPISTDVGDVPILIDAGAANAGATVRLFILDTAYYTEDSSPAPIPFTGNELNKNAIAIDVVLDANGRWTGTIPVTRTDNPATTEDDASLGINRIGATLVDENGDEGPFSTVLTVQLEAGATPATPTDNTIIATNAAETLRGTEAFDTFVFGTGTSTTSAIDQILNFEIGDTIDLSGIGITANDLEARLISDGNVLKLIEGFGTNDFQLKVKLDGISVDDVLDAIVFEGSSPPPPPPPPPDGENTVTATQAKENLLGTGANDVFTFGARTSTTTALDTIIDFEQGDTIDLSALGITRNDLETRLISNGNALKLIEGFGANDFQLKINLSNVSVDDVLAALVFDSGPTTPPNPPETSNTVIATEARENLSGADGADTYVFDVGTSTTQNIDTITDWAPGDVIDVSALGLSSEDLEARLISSGNTLKLIEGFGSGDFQLKVALNGYSVEQVLHSIRAESDADGQFSKAPVIYEVALPETFDFSALPGADQPALLDDGLIAPEPDQPAQSLDTNAAHFSSDIVIYQDDIGMDWIEA